MNVKNIRLRIQNKCSQLLYSVLKLYNFEYDRFCDTNITSDFAVFISFSI